ncbi:hypothetical protein [Mesorhizobium wenxiniae]|uniref:hypothetical protein n=1 Tax=Mesorhizobium wenxiniae TaxID=2014805 RepID=UPI0010562E6B|nr:hypothetical protein [Mesorhizobium wenxiniae]
MNEFHRSLDQADTLSTVHALSDRHLKDIDLGRSGTTFAVSEATDSQAPASKPPLVAESQQGREQTRDACSVDDAHASDRIGRHGVLG